MMARATRSSIKRKRSADEVGAPNKLARTTSDDEESILHAHTILPVLAAEDRQGLLDRVFHQQQASLRTLLAAPTPVSTLNAAIAHLRPISSARAPQSQTAAHQLRFCDLAASLLQQVPPAAAPQDHLQLSTILEPSSPPQRPQPRYALVQHLPSGDVWTSLASVSNNISDLQTGNAELVAVFPTPSSSDDMPIPTLGSYCPKPPTQKTVTPHRRVTTGAFLDYGPYSSFAPSFDQDGEFVGRRQVGEVLWYREERKRVRELNRQQAPAFIITDEPEIPVEEIDLGDQLDALLPPEQVDSIKAALESLELEKSVQQLLDRNQRALIRLGQLQAQRLTKHPTASAEEGSEEWDTAQSILDSLTLLASLRPRSSSQELPAIIPPPSVLHKLHQTLAIEPSPGWYGTLPPGRTTALRDDSTVKSRTGVVPPAQSTPVTTASTPVSATNVVANYPYAYASQQGAYRPQANYAAYKPGQATSYYQGYAPTGTQQAYYATGTANQQPYGATATGQQPYGYQWYGQYAPAGTGSGRGTPQPIAPQPAAMNYGSFFNSSATTPVAQGSRTPAVANTVAATPSVAYGQTAPTLPVHLRPGQAVTSNGQQNYFQIQSQSAAR